jgi:ASC-1-like (ASCH) protein
MKVHYLKLNPEYYLPIKLGEKTFEIRLNDRGFNVGDILAMEVYTGGRYTGQCLARQVTYITDYKQKRGYVVMGMKDV